jgi:predicted Fe-Mo cluster-binding NifX family protein
MRVVLPIHGDRISSVLDVARRFLLVDTTLDRVVTRKEVSIEDTDPITKTRRIVELGANVLICGAISWPLEAMLVSAGMRVIANTCGSLEEVVAAFIAGDLTDQAFLMPGCPGRRHRHRHRHGKKWWNT